MPGCELVARGTILQQLNAKGKQEQPTAELPVVAYCSKLNVNSW